VKPAARVPGQSFFPLLIRGLPLLLALVMPFLGGCQDRRWRAHTFNERGLVHHQNKSFAAARAEFEKSIAMGVTPEIPLYNLANTWLAEADYVQAHESYEAALELNPRLVEALYNDGHALQRWGETFVRIPPEDAEEVDWCALADMMGRAIQLLEQSSGRFERVVALEPESTLGRQASANLEAVHRRLKKLRELEEEYRKRCQGMGGGGGAAAGGGQSSTQGGGGGGGSSSSNSTSAGGQTGGGGSGGESTAGGPAADGGSGGGKGRPQPLNAAEREKLQQALERIRNQARQPDHAFRQSATQQFRKDESKRYEGKTIWW
jgi:tetratricopeptide (TPR) repeat protein